MIVRASRAHFFLLQTNSLDVIDTYKRKGRLAEETQQFSRFHVRLCFNLCRSEWQISLNAFLFLRMFFSKYCEVECKLIHLILVGGVALNVIAVLLDLLDPTVIYV